MSIFKKPKIKLSIPDRIFLFYALSYVSDITTYKYIYWLLTRSGSGALEGKLDLTRLFNYVTKDERKNDQK